MQSLWPSTLCFNSSRVIRSAAALLCTYMSVLLVFAAPNSLAASTRIAAGNGHATALKPDGTLWSWGDNTYGQLGVTCSSQYSPCQVGTGFKSVTSGRFSSAALKADGSLWAWGSNYVGQLGDGTTTDRKTPVQIGIGYSTVVMGGYYTLALKTDGSLWAWGDNSYGQLGDGTTTDRNTPKQIGAGYKVIAGGIEHSLALKDDGSLWAWGRNQYGQLGDGTFTNRNVPIQIGSGFIAISAGETHSLALKADGSLWMWGKMFYYRGGSPSTPIKSPVQIGTGYSAISSGMNHALALKTDGSLWTWGDNSEGQLGDGTTTDRITLAQIGTGYIDIKAGEWSSYAIKSDGSLLVWGSNYSGQLGNGELINRNTPSPNKLDLRPSPLPPVDLVASAIAPSAIKLSWKLPPESAQVKVFKVYRNSQLHVTVGNATSIDDTNNVTASTTYNYQVAACYVSNNDATCSARSATISVTTPATATTTLSGLTLTCPKRMGAGQGALCDARASYSNGTSKLVSFTSSWSLSQNIAMTLTGNANIKASSVSTNTDVMVTANYTEGNITKSATATVTVMASTDPTCTGTAGNTSALTISGVSAKKFGEPLEVHYCMKSFDSTIGVDIYVALKIPGGNFLFLRHWENGEITFPSSASSFLALSNATDTVLPVLDLPALPSSLPTGEYVFYAIQVPRGKDVLQSTNWIGQLKQASFTLQ